MSSATQTLKFVLLGEDKSASKALTGVGKSAKDAGTKLDGTGKNAANLKSLLGGLGAAAAGAAIVAFGKSSLEASQEAARSQRELEDAYKRFPAVGSVSIGKMRELNQAIQDKTGADADDIASSQAVLARYKLTGAQIADMTPLLVDYAARTGKDLPAAGKTLGKALAGNGRAMKELGVDFKDTGDPAKNFDQIMTGLKDKVGGFAESEATTLDGKLKILSAKFGDVQESVGDMLVPALSDLADVASQTIDFISQNADVLGPLAAVVGVAAIAYVALTVAGAAHTAYMAASAAATGGLTVAQWALNAALTANPIGLIVVAIAALVAGLIVAYKRSETFRNVVDGAFQAIGEAGRWLWNSALAPALRAILNGFAWVTDGIANMLDALGNIPGFEWAKKGAVSLRNLANDSRKAAKDLKDIPKSVDPKIKARDEATATIRKIDKEIKSLQGKKVKAEAEGDSSKVTKLQGKIRALQGKKVDIEAHVKKTGISTISIGASGSGLWRLRAVAAGGIVKPMAAGGVVRSAKIYDRADGVQFNEPDTRGEAYVPLANDWRRPRAVQVWRETGRILGQFAAGDIYPASAGASTVGSTVGGSQVINLTVGVARGVDPLAFAREVEAELTKLKRHNRKLAFQVT